MLLNLFIFFLLLNSNLVSSQDDRPFTVVIMEGAYEELKKDGWKSDWFPSCAGALITQNVVVTSAFCLSAKKFKSKINFKVVAIVDKHTKSLDGVQTYKMSWSKVHPLYSRNRDDWLHDIGVCQLIHSLPTDRVVSAPMLPIFYQEPQIYQLQPFNAWRGPGQFDLYHVLSSSAETCSVQKPTMLLCFNDTDNLPIYFYHAQDGSGLMVNYGGKGYIAGVYLDYMLYAYYTPISLYYRWIQQTIDSSGK